LLGVVQLSRTSKTIEPKICAAIFFRVKEGSVAVILNMHHIIR